MEVGIAITVQITCIAFNVLQQLEPVLNVIKLKIMEQIQQQELVKHALQTVQHAKGLIISIALLVSH